MRLRSDDGSIDIQVISIGKTEFPLLAKGKRTGALLDVIRLEIYGTPTKPEQLNPDDRIPDVPNPV